MPIFSPLVVVVVVDGLPDVVVVLLPSLVIELLLFEVVSVLPHPIKIAAHRTARIKELFLNIGYSFSSSEPDRLNRYGKGLKSGAMIHDKQEIDTCLAN